MKQLIMHTFSQIEQLTTVDFGERECSVKAENKDGDTESSEVDSSDVLRKGPCAYNAGSEKNAVSIGLTIDRRVDML